LNYVLAKQGCMNCDNQWVSRVKVNNQDYSSSAEKKDEMYITVEPNSGFMIE
jgi:hypothetical protein